MKRVIGLMSGTSMDGVDAAVTELSGHRERPRVRILCFLSLPYPKRLKARLLRLSENDPLPVRELCQLNFLVGELFAAAALKACGKAGVSPDQIDIIGSHGQTVQHISGSQRLVSSTLQIGEPAVIAERTGITTVADFRPADIAHGGLGAPLTPYAHWLLFRHPWKSRAIHNLGGISNLTYLPRGSPIDGVLAFDTGPANVLMDTYVRLLTGGTEQFDKEGKQAAKGRIATRWLEKLLNHPFLSKAPPKATGREDFGEHLVKPLINATLRGAISPADALATLAAFTARSIGDAYRQFVFSKGGLEEIFFSGGGRKNLTLVQMIRRELPHTRIRLIDELGIDGDALEAMAFGILACQAVSGERLALGSATRAQGSAILGKIVPGRNFSRALLKHT